MVQQKFQRPAIVGPVATHTTPTPATHRNPLKYGMFVWEAYNFLHLVNSKVWKTSCQIPMVVSNFFMIKIHGAKGIFTHVWLFFVKW